MIVSPCNVSLRFNFLSLTYALIANQLEGGSDATSSSVQEVGAPDAVDMCSTVFQE